MLSTVEVAGAVGGTARSDSVVVTYQSQRLVLAGSQFRTQLLTTRIGPAIIRADVYSSEAETVSRAVSHEVTASGVPAPLLAFFDRLGSYLPAKRQQLRDELPRNPGNATYFQQKIALLSDPGLLARMATGHNYVWATAARARGDSLQVLLGFPEESMRAEAAEVIQRVGEVLPHLETLVGRPFPYEVIQLVYGFGVGSSGGGGWVDLEDRGTYEARRRPGMVEFQPVIAHELGHSYIGHEGITQFIELYGHNRADGFTEDPTTWAETRGWAPGRASNTGVHAILDIATLIGPAAMSRIMRRLRALNPPYGASLSVAGQSIFVDESPAEHQSAVTALASRIGY